MKGDDEMKKINLCVWCIQGWQSHGEHVYVGDWVEEVCDSCGEEEDRVHECLVAD